MKKQRNFGLMLFHGKPGQIQPVACFYIAWELKIVFLYILKDCRRNKE
jgi:hypothetical protein